jgi:oligoendopeptidase F
MLKQRKDIPEKYKWNLDQYFASDQEWEDMFLKVEKKYKQIAAFEGKLDNPNSIFECLSFQSNIGKKLGLLYVYAALRTKEDQADSKAQERLEKISALSTKYSAEVSFVDVELSSLSTEVLTSLMNNKQFPQFKNYFYNILRFKPYMLSKKEERLLSLMGDFADGFGDNFEKFDDADLKFDPVLDSKGNSHELTHANFILFMESPDRTLRKNTLASMNGAYQKFNNFLASNYISNIKKNKFSASIRGFDSALAASIFVEDASEKVYQTLIDCVHDALPLFHKYLALKQKQLGLADFALYDIYAPTAQEVDLKLEYEQAIETIKKATAVLGQDYIDLIERAKTERWIDVLPNQNKDSGAFAWGAYGAHPVVLLNYVKNTNSVFTLAHELGHCMHTYYSNTNQPYELAGYTIFVAEVASTVNEMLLLEHLLSQAKTDQEKIYYYDYVLSTVRGTIFRQTMFSEFEAFAHNQVEKDLPISKDVLNDFYYSLNQKYFGQHVELPKEITFEWSRIPHFYSSFYVYKYATGLISALAIVSNILSGKPNAAENYKKFLSSGSSLPPIELLKIAGVDLTNKQTFDSAFGYVKSVLDRWESINKNNQNCQTM